METPLTFGLWVDCSHCGTCRCYGFGVRKWPPLTLWDFTEDTWSLFIVRCESCDQPLFPAAYEECVLLRKRMKEATAHVRVPGELG